MLDAAQQLQLTGVPSAALTASCLGLWVAFKQSPSRFGLLVAWEAMIFALCVGWVLNSIFAHFLPDQNQLAEMLQKGPAFGGALALSAIVPAMARPAWRGAKEKAASGIGGLKRMVLRKRD